MPRIRPFIRCSAFDVACRMFPQACCLSAIPQDDIERRPLGATSIGGACGRHSQTDGTPGLLWPGKTRFLRRSSGGARRRNTPLRNRPHKVQSDHKRGAATDSASCGPGRVARHPRRHARSRRSRPVEPTHQTDASVSPESVGSRLHPAPPQTQPHRRSPSATVVSSTGKNGSRHHR